MQVKSLDSILGSFNPNDSLSNVSELRGGRPVTIWLPEKYKTAYDKLQRASGRGFSKKLRELIEAAIDATESKAG